MLFRSTDVDRICIPAFSNSLPASKSWSRKPPTDEAFEKLLFARLKVLVEAGLTSRDLTLAWLSRRIYPLQARSHKMCFYSGIRDPIRVSMEIPKPATICKWASRLITDRMEEDCEFGLYPYSRSARAPEVSHYFLVHLQFLRPASLSASGCRLTQPARRVDLRSSAG